MNRLPHDVDHAWHVALNAFVGFGPGQFESWGWMYEARHLADEVPRMAVLFRMEREGALADTHRQCSYAEPVPVVDNHLTCCLGVNCRECPALLAIEKAGLSPEDTDTAKAWTCGAHIVSRGGDVAREGYLLTVDDRMYWERVYANMSAADPGGDE